MKLRMKAKHYQGSSRVSKLLPIPGCLKYDERLAIYNALQTPITREQRQELEAQLLDICKDIPTRNATDAIILNLNHGDIVIMHGEKVQEYFEVSCLRWHYTSVLEY